MHCYASKEMVSCFHANELVSLRIFFFFNDTATTEIYTLSLHDALPIYTTRRTARRPATAWAGSPAAAAAGPDRKSTRLNSSHGYISYAVFCLKKKNKTVNMR